MDVRSLWIIKKTTYRFLSIVGLLATFYVLFSTPIGSASALFFSIPLSWSVGVFVFQDIFQYHKGGAGLKVFYVISFLKYIVLPVLTCISGSFSVRYGPLTMGEFTYAILIQNVEILVCFASIKYFYAREFNKFPKRYRENYYDSLSLGGVFVIAIAAMIIIARGLDRLLVSMRFGLITEKLSADAMYGYDIWLAHTMMGFLALISVDTFKLRNDVKKSFVNIIIPVIFVTLSCMTIFGNNRVMIIYYAGCGLVVLNKAFPEKKRFFLITIIPVIIIVLLSFTLMKQFGYDVLGSASRLGTNINDLSSSMSDYLCGTESIAKTFRMYGINGNKMHPFTLFSDLVHKTTILGLPGLNNIVAAFSNIPTSYSLAMISTEIIPISAQTLFYGGYVLGPILDIIANIFVMWLLVKFELRSKESNNSADIYVFTWMSLVVAFCMTRSLAIIYNNCTYAPMYILIATRVNRWIKIRTKRG